MELTPQEIRLKFLDSIKNENNVSDEAIDECMEKHEDEIENMDEIFSLDNELAGKKRMVLLSLVSRNRAKENLEYYKEAENISFEFNSSLVDEYKVLLIAALMSNTLFFVRACNWCGLVGMEANRMQPPFKIIGKSPNRVILRFPEPKDDAIAADGTGFESFLQAHLVCNNIHGTLYFKGNDQHEVLLVFCFDEPHDAIPFELDVCFTTKSDHREHTITIPENNRIEGTNIIKSNITGGVYYSDGIEGDYTVTVKLRDTP